MTTHSRGGGVLVVALGIDSLGNGLFLPLSLVYFLELTDVPLGLLGVLLSLANAITLPLPIWVGSVADRIGPLPVVIASQLLQAAGFLAYAWVSGPIGVFVASTLVAIGVRAFWSTIFTAIADYADGASTSRSTDSWYAVSNGSRTAGLALGGMVTGLLVADGQHAAYRAAALATAASFAVAAALIAGYVRAPRRAHREALPRSGYATLLRDGPFLGLTALNTVYALASIMLGLALPTVVLVEVDGPSWLTASILAGNAVLIAALSGPVVRRLDGVRRTRSIAVAAGLWCGWALLMAALGPGEVGAVVAVLIGATVLFTSAELIHAPVSTALAASAAPGPYRGRYLAAFQYSFTAASIAAPAFFAVTFAFDPAAPWLLLAGAMALSVPGLLSLERRLPAASVHPTLVRSGA